LCILDSPIPVPTTVAFHHIHSGLHI